MGVARDVKAAIETNFGSQFWASLLRSVQRRKRKLFVSSQEDTKQNNCQIRAILRATFNFDFVDFEFRCAFVDCSLLRVCFLAAGIKQAKVASLRNCEFCSGARLASGFVWRPAKPKLKNAKPTWKAQCTPQVTSRCCASCHFHDWPSAGQIKQKLKSAGICNLRELQRRAQIENSFKMNANWINKRAEFVFWCCEFALPQTKTADLSVYCFAATIRRLSKAELNWKSAPRSASLVRRKLTNCFVCFRFALIRVCFVSANCHGSRLQMLGELLSTSWQTASRKAANEKRAQQTRVA